MQCSTNESGSGCCTDQISIPISYLQVTNLTASVSAGPEDISWKKNPSRAPQWMSQRTCSIKFQFSDGNFGAAFILVLLPIVQPLTSSCECKWSCSSTSELMKWNHGFCQCGFTNQTVTSWQKNELVLPVNYAISGGGGWEANIQGSTIGPKDRFNATITISTRHVLQLLNGMLIINKYPPVTCYGGSTDDNQPLKLCENVFITNQLHLSSGDFRQIDMIKQSNQETIMGSEKKFQAEKEMLIVPITNICPGGQDCIEPSKFFTSVLSSN
jgi:hypothetical protein